MAPERAAPCVERVMAADSPPPPFRRVQRRKVAWPSRAGRAALMRRIPWPLLSVLTLQSVASLSLVRSNTAFQDEALYLWAGHLQISHWLHGTPIPAFPTYFSGAPVLYPPLGALADSIGGLAGARILSLIFMLGATAFLWALVRRHFGWRCALFACTFFALLGVTLRLDAFATYDAMSLFLLAASAWCAVRAAESQNTYGWMAAAVVALSLANATKYASALFDPVVAGLLVAASLQALPARRALLRGAAFLGYVAGACAILLLIGGGEYLTGLLQTTLARTTGTTSASAVIAETWRLSGILMAVAAAGVLLGIATKRTRAEIALIAVSACAALLVPAEYLHLASLTSLSKHLDFGMWFAAVAAGYAVDRLIELLPARGLRIAASAACALALATLVLLGSSQARDLFRTWPNSTALVSRVASLLPQTRGPILAENPSLLEYYLPQGREWERWSSTCSIRIPQGVAISRSVGLCVPPSRYATFIHRGFFSSVILLFGQRGGFDGAVTAALQANGHYHLDALVRYGHRKAAVWVYRPQSRFLSQSAYPTAPQITPLQELVNPTARPRPILGPIAAGVGISGLLTVALMLSIRLGWRRGRASLEL